MTPSIDLPRREPDNGPMEARIARIETHIEHLNANVADLRTGFARLDAKVDDFYFRLDAKIDGVEKRLDAKIDGVEKRLNAKIDGVEQRLDAKIDASGQRLDAKIDRLGIKVDRDFVVLGGMIVSLGVGMAGLMAKGFHWL